MFAKYPSFPTKFIIYLNYPIPKVYTLQKYAIIYISLNYVHICPPPTRIYTQTNLPVNTKARMHSQLYTNKLNHCLFTCKTLRPRMGTYTKNRKFSKHMHNHTQSTHLISCMNKSSTCGLLTKCTFTYQYLQRVVIHMHLFAPRFYKMQNFK